MSDNGFQCIHVENIDDVSVVRFADDKVMDPARIEQLGGELLRLSESQSEPRVVINFSDVKFFSSAAINKLIVLEKKVRAKGGRMRLTNLRPEVRDLFGFTQLDSLFQIYDQQAEAVVELTTK
ncbi:MAG: STAS domain-containing protein [Pirellulaceae bacterium]